MKINKAGRPLHQTFASLTEAVVAARTCPDWTDAYRSSRRDSFAGNVTFSEAADLATLGWQDGSRKASERATRVVDRVVQSTSVDTTDERFTWDVTGACFDVGTYLSGEPECWLQLEQVQVRRGIHICVNAAASGGVPADTLMARGIAIASLVLALQAKGYPVTVDVVEVSDHPVDGRQSVVVRVIDADGAPLDVDRLVFALAHPAMLRIVIANAYGAYYQWGSGIPDSNGKPHDAPEYDLYIGGVHLYDTERWTSEERAMEWVVEQYLKQTA